MEILLWFLVWALGLFMGFCLAAILRRYSYSGVIVVSKEDDKTIYSLELEDDPENIALQKEIIFRVHALEEGLNRE